MIAALFVAGNGCYVGVDGVDPWDERRDARLYAGPYPVVAHPPCARWSMLAGLVEARYGHKRGDDGGCFASALASVRTYGGVLEHPAHSKAWPAFGLRKPRDFGWWWRTDCGGHVCHVEQGHYGHRARKATWLYAFGMTQAQLPQLRWGRAKASAWCTPGASEKASRGKSVLPMNKRERLATPIEFRDVLIGIARSAVGVVSVTSTPISTVERASKGERS